MAYLPDNIQVLRLGTTQKVAATTASGAISTAIATDIARVAVSSDNDVYVAIGSAPTATTADFLLSKGAIEFYRVDAGVSKLAFLTTTGTATVTVTEAS